MKHKHRILPGHMGGEYIEGNVIEVEVTQCDRQTANHTMWHFANWQLWRKEGDRVAWKTLSGYYSKEDAIHAMSMEGSRKSGRLARESGQILKIATKESTRKGGEITGRRNKELGHIQKVGREQGRKNAESGHMEKISTPASRSKGGAMSGSRKWVDPDHPEIGEHNAGNLVKLQKKLGYPCGKENRVKLG